MKRPLPLSEPSLTTLERRYVAECVESGWISSVGPFVDRFEKAFASTVGSPHAIGVVNGTAAVHIALLAVGVKPGDEVLVSDLTFVAPANAIRYCGAHPVFLDARLDTWQLDEEKLERFLARECVRRRGATIDKRTGRVVRAIVPVHILGSALRIDRIVAIARRWGLKIVEDSCEAVGTRYLGRAPGTFGDAGAFSFNGNKIVTTGGGGMVVTSNEAIASKIRYLTTQAKDDPIEYYHKEIGFNYRLTSLPAALGLAQLERLGELMSARRALADAYDEEFSDSSVTPMPKPEGVEQTWWLYTALLPPKTSLARRKKVVAALNAQGIGSRPLWHTLHDLPPFIHERSDRISAASELYRRAVSLPSSPHLTPDDARRCARALKALV
jgi:perosamine synthetase